MTFEEWTIKQGFKHPEFGIQVSLTQYALMQNAWNAAMEAAVTKIVRGTNLYNISGDHISGKIIDNIVKLKSS